MLQKANGLTRYQPIERKVCHNAAMDRRLAQEGAKSTRVLATSVAAFTVTFGWAGSAWLLGQGSSAVSPTPDVNDGVHQVIDHQKKDERALELYERIEKVEVRRSASDLKPGSVRVTRLVPTGTGLDRIPVGPDGKPTDVAAYRADLQKLIGALHWVQQDGPQQREAHEKAAKKRKERESLIDATRSGFVYTFVENEPRSFSMLAKYRIEPNPKFRPSTRTETVFTRVRGYVWIDEKAHELAKVEADVTEDISLGVFLAKIYKGSHFMQERYEVQPGFWAPTFSQYDFDGRRFFMGFAIHERTFYWNYKRIGPPQEAVEAIRAELDTSAATPADP